MTAPLVFAVRGTPRPQPRPRFVNGRVVSTADAKASLWRMAVARAVKKAIEQRGDELPVFRGSIRVSMIFTFVPPLTKAERIGQPHTQKPDASNLLKLVEDVMEDCGMFKNDSQISKPVPEKWWADQAGVTVTVETMAAEAAPVARGSQPAPDWLASAKPAHDAPRGAYQRR